MKLPPRKPRKPNETSSIVKPAIAGLNRLCGVRAWRNNVGQLGSIRFGLAVGSADIIGIVATRLPGHRGSLGRFFAIECKLPGKDLEPDQRRWMECVADFGGLAFVAYSAAQAVEFIDRYRDRL